MNCPVCKRELAPTLSICLTCGAMMNDTVREELQTKLVTTGNSGELVKRKLPPAMPEPQAAAQTLPPRRVAVPVTPPARMTPKPERAPAPRPEPVKFETSELGNKKTSPTLVGFQSKNAAMPDWRLQLQNSIRQRRGPAADAAESTGEPSGGFQKQLVTRGANALKADYVEEKDPAELTNPKVANALKRIEQSRKTFLPEAAKPEPAAQQAGKNYPFNVVAGSDAGVHAPTPRATVNPALRPRLVSSLRIEKKGFDTNKLPPLSTISKANSGKLEAAAAAQLEHVNSRLLDEEVITAGTTAVEPAPPVEEVEIEGIDDLAPVSMRFNAGLFDLIIGGFASLILLSPFMLGGGTWLSISGFLAFAAAMSIVMFVYLTASIAFYGRSLGMRLFSLELVDAEENEYPSLHQAAVNSAVFLASLALAGVGFVPMLFNDERRAAHDLIAGTILIREY